LKKNKKQIFAKALSNRKNKNKRGLRIWGCGGNKKVNQLTHIIQVTVVKLIRERSIKIFQYHPGSRRVLQRENQTIKTLHASMK
jgi:hypothetical protein